MTPKTHFIKRDPELTKQINHLRVQRWYWFNKLRYSDLTDDQIEDYNQRIDNIILQISKLTGENPSTIYRRINVGHPGRPSGVDQV